MIDNLKYTVKLAKLKIVNKTLPELEIDWCHPAIAVQELKDIGDKLSLTDCQSVLVILDLQDTRSIFINNSLKHFDLTLEEFTASLQKLSHHGIIDYSLTYTKARKVKMIRKHNSKDWRAKNGTTQNVQ